MGNAAAATPCITDGQDVSSEVYFLPEVKLGKEDGFYACGEEAVVTASPLMKGGKIAMDATLRGEILWESVSVSVRDFAVGEAVELRYTSTIPGWVHFKFAVIDGAGKVVENPGNTQRQYCQDKQLIYQIGALFDAEKITSSAPVPADFDEYWKSFIAEGEAVPMEVTYPDFPIPAEDLETAVKADVTLQYYQVTCKGPTPCFGYLSKPKNAKKRSLPLVVNFQSWYNAPPYAPGAVEYARQNALALYCTWHGIVLSDGGETYDMAYIEKTQQAMGFRHDIGVDSRETWAFRDVFYRVARNIDFGKSLPEWNGKDIIVVGGSLGGAQSGWAAAFYPGVTMSLVEIPGFTDYHSNLDGRTLPPWLSEKITPVSQKALAYYSLANFALRIKTPTYWCTGFVDTGCHPSDLQ